MIDISDSNTLRITDCYFKHKEIHLDLKYKKRRSIIDYAIIGQDANIQIIDVKVHRGIRCGSNAHMLGTTITFSTNHYNKTNKNNAQKIPLPLQTLDCRIKAVPYPYVTSTD